MPVSTLSMGVGQQLLRRSDNTPITLGAEFESVVATRNKMLELLADLSREKNFIGSVTRDASVESTRLAVTNSTSIFLGNSIVRNGLRRSGAREDITMGYEAVTNPLEIEDMRDAIKHIINIQVKNGEIFSNRSSIHIHAGFPRGYIFLKSATAVGLAIEPLFFKIAGMGRVYRGVANSSNYCRPLAMPPAVHLTDCKSLAVLDPIGALSAEDENSFWYKFGGIRPGDHDRYNPVRYTGINLFSTVLRGTMEFRFFNFCTVSKYVEAIAGLCQFTADMMIRAPLNIMKMLPHVSIFEINSDEAYKQLFKEFLGLGVKYGTEFPMRSCDVDSILELIDITPQPVFEKRDILSHIQNGRISLEDAKRAGLRIIEEAISPEIVDIHNFGKTNRQLGDFICAS